ncbi:hypothetical protein RN001_009881 [Aquatica leii]|uniref:Titin n=1 Tax=Aquatica leii TaxID=1421715 RepID=A0AAN7P057_9COLE|nr:hypothetical protein RN001_009881 [Aquatica leii]
MKIYINYKNKLGHVSLSFLSVVFKLCAMGNTSAKPHRRFNQNKKQVHWKAADRPGPPGKPQLVSESELTPDVVTIRWDPSKFDGGSPIIGYLVEHRRYGSPHWVRATPQLVRFTEISLSGLEPGWRYQFRVSAENAVGLSVPGELSELLTVTLQRSAVAAPRFINELVDTVVLENEKIEFSAQFLGQPTPKISWFKDGFEIFSSRRIRIVTENEKSTLIIHQSSFSDVGEIKCTATNKAGHASIKAQVTLEAPPSIRLPRQYEDGLLFELEETIRLKVSVAGCPPPTIFWSHNNELINTNNHYEIENTDKHASLRIQAAERTDRGEYQVKAVNKLGEAVSSFLVTVTDKPSPPGRVQVVMTLGKSVTLAWRSPTDDGGCKIGNYIVEYFRLGWDVWLKAATCRQLTTTIGDLIEGSEYKFRIKAESPYGISEPSEESDTIFIPDTKRGILSPLRSHSQPRDVLINKNAPLPAARKPRSLSSTRPEPSNPTTPVYFYEGGIPKRPARTKTKTPSLTPEPSPVITRKRINPDINKHILDRTSIARDLAYGSPEIKMEKPSFDASKFYHSEKLDEMPTIAVKSTVNVIHYQNPTKESTASNNKTEEISQPALIESQVLLKNKDRTRETCTKSSPERVLANSPPKTHKLTEDKEIPLLKTVELTHSLRQDVQKELIRKRSPSPLRLSRSRSPSPSKFYDYENAISNESPMLQNKNHPLSNSSEFMLVLLPDKSKDEGNIRDAELNFDEQLIPPPMSLSAPELGAEELVFEPLRCSVSSSELLYENALKRFQEFAEMEGKEHNERLNVNIPKIQINSKDDQLIVGLDRSNSLRRRSSGGLTIPQQHNWNYRRHSLKNAPEISDIPENTLRRFPIILDSKSDERTIPELPSTTPLSIESKREIFAKRQRSESEEREEEEFKKVRLKMANQKKEPKKTVGVIQETDWDDLTNEGNIYEESMSDSESSEDMRTENYKFKPIRAEEDEETYHPGLMHQINSTKLKNTNDPPFQILTNPTPLPDPNFVPKPILKKKQDNLDKPSRKSKDTNKSREKSLPVNSHSTNSFEAFEGTSKQRLFSLFPQNKSSKKKNPENKMFKKRAHSPAVQPRQAEISPPTTMSNVNASFPVLPPVQRRADDEIKVVVDHYGDIVRSYGHRMRTVPRLILNADDLKAAAEKESEEEAVKLEESEPESPSDESAAKQSVVRRPSFIEASSALIRTVKESVSAAFANDPMEDDVIPPDAEIIPSMIRRGSNQMSKKKSPKSSLKLDISKTNKKTALPKSENWSHLRSPSPGPTGKKSPATMRRNSLNPPSVQRRNSPGSISPIPFAKPKVREITTQTSRYEDSRMKQEELSAKAEIKVRTTVDYITDLAMFIVACWLYLFQNELLAIPVLLVMVYRQLKEEINKKLPVWMTGKKKAKRK